MLRVPEPPQELRPITAPGSISACQHSSTTSSTHANKSNARHVQPLVPAPMRPTTLSSRHPLARLSVATLSHPTTPGRPSDPSPIRQKPADDARSGGQKRQYVSKLGVADRSSGWARPRRAGLAKKEQSDRDRDHACSGGSIPAGLHRRGARLSSSPDPRRRSSTSTLSRSLWRKPK